MPSFPTMATDGRRLAYNPAFVEKLTATELEGVLAHEVMHCALAHHCRRGDVKLNYGTGPQLCGQPNSHRQWDDASKDALIDPSFADLSAEEIYARLMKQEHGSREAGARSNRAHTRQLAVTEVMVQGKHHKLGRKRRHRCSGNPSNNNPN